MNAEMANQSKPQGNELAATLEKLAKMVLGKQFRSMREMIQDIESRLSKKVEANNQAVKDSVQSLKQELGEKEKTTGNRLDDMVQRLNKTGDGLQESLKELEGNLNSKHTLLKEKVSASTMEVNKQMDAREKSIGQKMQREMERMQQKVGVLTGSLDQLKEEIQALQTEQAKISGFMTNFSKVFAAGQQIPGQPAPMEETAPVAPAPKAPLGEEPVQSADTDTASDDVPPEIKDWVGKTRKIKTIK